MKVFEVTSPKGDMDRSPVSRVTRAIKQVVPWFANNAESKGLSSTIGKSGVQKDGGSIVNVELGHPYEHNPYESSKWQKDISSMHPDPKIAAMLKAKIMAKSDDAEKLRLKNHADWEAARSERAKDSAKWRRDAMEKVYDAVKGMEGVKMVGVPSAYRGDKEWSTISKYEYIPIEDFDPNKYDWSKPFRFKFKFEEGTHKENFNLQAAREQMLAFAMHEFKKNPKLKGLTLTQHGNVTLPDNEADNEELKKAWSGSTERYNELSRKVKDDATTRVQDYLAKNKKTLANLMNELIAKYLEQSKSQAKVSFVPVKFDGDYWPYKGLGSFNVRRP